MTVNNEVWVYAERKGERVHNVVYELLGGARELADRLGGKVSLIVNSVGFTQNPQELIDCGADKIYLMKHPLLEQYNNELFTKAICQLIEEKNPRIILFGSVFDRRDLAPRIAARLDRGLISEGKSVDLDEENNLVITKVSFGGSLLGKIKSVSGEFPQMASFRVGELKGFRREGRTGEVIEYIPKLEEADMLTKIREVAKVAKKVVALTDADIVVSGGKGVGGPEGFKLIEQLAERLNGVVGASRVAVDLGWIDYAHQVGQAGETVKPKIYIACGISGASQHIIGMWESDVVIAINTHPYAAIFNFADYGIVGDLFEVIPKLLEELDKHSEK